MSHHLIDIPDLPDWSAWPKPNAHDVLRLEMLAAIERQRERYRVGNPRRVLAERVTEIVAMTLSGLVEQKPAEMCTVDWFNGHATRMADRMVHDVAFRSVVNAIAAQVRQEVEAYLDAGEDRHA